MKVDLRPDGGGGAEREELRSFLRQWVVLSPPPEIEEDLRRTYRRRRARGRPTHRLTLAAAAALVLLAVLRIGVTDRAVRPAPSAPPIAVASPPAPTPPPAAPEVGRPGSASRRGGGPSQPVSAARRPGGPAPAPREAEVIVEPGQARLLAELGRKLWDVRYTARGTTVPQIEGASVVGPATMAAPEDEDVPVYRGEWETVAGEWPYVHRSRPGR